MPVESASLNIERFSVVVQPTISSQFNLSTYEHISRPFHFPNVSNNFQFGIHVRGIDRVVHGVVELFCWDTLMMKKRDGRGYIRLEIGSFGKS